MSYDRLIFIHIPKTAGSTVNNLLECHFAPSQVHSFRHFELPSQECFARLPEERKAGFRLLKGHLPFGMAERMPGHSAYFSMLRNPVERVISHYRYLRRRWREGGCWETMSLREFVEGTRSYRNIQAAYLAGYLQWPEGMKTEHLIELAWRNVQEHFVFVGLQERFDESMLLLFEKLRLPGEPWYVVRNMGGGKPLIDAEIRKRIQECNGADEEIYRRVSGLLEKECGDRGPEWACRVGRFGEINRQLQMRTRFHFIWRRLYCRSRWWWEGRW